MVRSKKQRNDMPKETDEVKRLEARVVELENALKVLMAVKEPVDLSADEIKAYLKVRNALSCDILRCSCRGCVAILRCSCHRPCVSYACDIGYFEGGALGRFTDLGS
jgi:hypothetical protein